MAAVPSISATAIEALGLQQELRDAAIVRNEELVLQRATRQKEKRTRYVERLRSTNKRLARAVQAVAALSSVCTSPDVRALIATQGGLCLWTGFLRIGGDGGIMESRFGILLSADGLAIHDQTWFDGKLDAETSSVFMLPYAGDSLISQLRLAQIATSKGCDPRIETNRFESLDGNNVDPADILFQVLVECSDPKTLTQYLLKAIKP